MASASMRHSTTARPPPGMVIKGSPERRLVMGPRREDVSLPDAVPLWGKVVETIDEDPVGRIFKAGGGSDEADSIGLHRPTFRPGRG